MSFFVQGECSEKKKTKEEEEEKKKLKVEIAQHGKHKPRQLHYSDNLSKKKNHTREIIALVCGDIKMFSIVEHTLGWLH